MNRSEERFGDYVYSFQAGKMGEAMGKMDGGLERKGVGHIE
jgi:hypothetical protein